MNANSLKILTHKLYLFYLHNVPLKRGKYRLGVLTHSLVGDALYKVAGISLLQKQDIYDFLVNIHLNPLTEKGRKTILNMMKYLFRFNVLQKTVILAVTIIIFFAQNPGFSQEEKELGVSNDITSNNSQACGSRKDSPKDAVFAFIFKILAKAYVSTMDIEALKKENIDSINKMDEESFHLFYLDFYEHISKVSFININYGLNEDISKEEAVSKIKSLDKQKLYAIIDSLPNEIIISEFKRYLSNNNKQAPQIDNASQVRQSLGQMIESIKNKYIGK